MKKKLLIALAVVLALTFITGSAVLTYRHRMEQASAESNALAHSLVDIPAPDELPSPSPDIPGETPVPEEPEPLPETGSRPPLRDPYAESLADTDLAPLRQINGDVLGWIEIPDTRISYPLLQYSDNNFYLSRSWQKYDNPAGSIFLEYQNAPDFSDFNTLIYGHRMNSGDMFGTLHMFSEQEYLDAHPRVYIVTDIGCRVYAIFAACEVPVDSRVYAMNFSNDIYKQAYIDHCLEQSEVTGNVELSPADSFITLSTCTKLSGHGYRFVVQAVYVGTAPRSPAPGQEIS